MNIADLLARAKVAPSSLNDALRTIDMLSDALERLSAEQDEVKKGRDILSDMAAQYEARAEAADAEIVRLREQLASAAWQPIETAPRDGSRIWVFVREYDPQEYVVSWATTVDLPKDHEDYWEGWVFADEILVNHCSEDIDPSHWMPLPAAPLTDDLRAGK